MFQSTGLALNFSTPSRLTTRREIVALLRGPMPAPTVYLGTDDFLRLGQWHAPALAKLPEPSDARKNDFGMQESGAFSVEVPTPSDTAAYVDVADNKAVDLDGINDKLTVTSSASLNFGTGSFTIVARIKHRDFAYPKTMAAFQKPSPAGWNLGSGWGIGSGYNAAALYVWMHDGTTFAGGNIALDDGYRPPQLLNQFADIAVIFNRAAGVNVARVLVNGVMQSGSLDLSALAGSVNNVNPFEFGTSVGWLLDGVVDEIQAWSRALSISEIAAMRRKRLKGSEAGLAMLLRCDESAGLTAFDATANANNATLTFGPTWTTGAPLDARDQFARLPTLLKNQPIDLDLLTRTYREDGTSIDFINERRGVVKSITRKRSGIELNIVDIDRVALKTLYPLHTFTIADWPLLFADHVNRAVPNGVGTGEKIPCTYVDNTVGAYKYAVCEIRAGLAAPAVLTVYRGKASGQGQIVPAAEYAVSTSLVGGINYLLLTFTREQVDFDNQKFIIEADILSAGSRLGADELAYLLQAIGLTIDAADFADAAAYHALINARVDAWYTKQITADSIAAPLMEAGRCWLSQAIGGAYSIFVDRPRAPQRVLWDDADQIQIDSRREPEVAKTITLQYRPRPANRSEMAGDLSRTTTGASGEKIFKNEFVRDHDVADALLCYLTLKEQRADIEGTVYGVSLQPGELLAVNSALVFDGWKTLAAPSISRPAGANRCTFEEYTETDYLYTPGTLPADATNAYSPDYSYTPPAAPTALAVISQGITVDVDGKGLAYALIRAVPPTVNWQKLTAQIRNTVTNEIYQAQLTLSGGNYEAVIPGLRPNVAHQVIAWATNANAIDGVTAAAVAFTSANYSAVPSAPTALAVAQTGADMVEVSFTPSASGSVVKEYIPYVQIGAGAFVAQPVVQGARYVHRVATLGSALTFKFKAVDRFGNQSADSSTAAITPTAYLGDYHVTPLGIGAASVTNSSLKQGKMNTAANSGSVSMAAGDTLDLCQNTGGYSLVPIVTCTADVEIHAHYSALSTAGSLTAVNKAGFTQTVTYSELRLTV